MSKKLIAPMILAVATLLAAPATARGQVNPALIGEGALIWGNNCGRCHNIRPTTERSDAEWVIIVKHMRARANLTRYQAEAVLAYLQATNTAETTAATPTAAARSESQHADAGSDGAGPGETRVSSARVAPPGGRSSPADGAEIRR